ncbi:hypothetical protein ACHAO9_009901 [Fusarium lateritium]
MAPQGGPKRQPMVFPPPPRDPTNAGVERTVSSEIIDSNRMQDRTANVVQRAESAAPHRSTATMPIRAPPNGQLLRSSAQSHRDNSADISDLFASNRTGRANVRQQGSTVSVSAPETNVASPTVERTPVTATTDLTTPAEVQHSAPTQQNEEGEPKKRRPGRPRKVMPDTLSRNVSMTGSQGQPSSRAANMSRNEEREPTRRRPGRPRKVVPAPVSQDEEVYHDDDIDSDYIDEDEGLNQISGQSDERQQTLTRRTRSTPLRGPGNAQLRPLPMSVPPQNNSQRSTRRVRALRNENKKWDMAIKRERTRLEAPNSFMTKEIYEAPGKPGYPGPSPEFDGLWRDDDEAKLIQTYYSGTPLEHLTSDSNTNNTIMNCSALVFRASLHFFKMDPLTLFTKGLNDIVIVTDTKSSTMIDGHLYTSPFWSAPFCEKLSRIIFHPLWCGPAPWTFMLFAIKWAVICRTDDRRPIHQMDINLLKEYFCNMDQDPALSHAAIHAEEQRKMVARGGISTPQAELLSEIAEFTIPFRQDTSGRFYKVATQDLTAVIHGLDSLRGAFNHDCEFYFQAFSEAHNRLLYPSGKEMPVLYKNCYLSVERKKSLDFKRYGNNMTDFESKRLQLPSKPPRKIESALERAEPELVEDTPPRPPATKRKNTDEDLRPRKAARREEVPRDRPEKPMAQPPPSIPDDLSTVDVQVSRPQPVQTRYDSSGRLVFRSLSDAWMGHIPDPAALKGEGFYE